MMRVLILMDEATVRLLETGAPPVSAFSHDKNLFQFAHESLRKGYQVFLATIQRPIDQRSHHEVLSVFPQWRQSEHSIVHEAVNPDIVVSVFLEAMNIKHHYPVAKLVAIIPAVHWIESPDNFPAHHLFDTITAARFNVDFLITQNERMKSIIDAFFRYVAHARLTDRILVCPLGIVEEERREAGDRIRTREEMGLSPTDIAIINSGGVWHWTDFATFLRAYCEDAHENGAGLRLFIMGLQQPQNREHDDYIAGVRAILKANQSLIGAAIIVEEDWYKASQDILRYTRAADIGLNVNHDSIENWQSYRLRFLDYMYFGLPAINTTGDTITDSLGDEVVFPVKSGDVESYKQTLREIRGDPSVVRRKADGMRRLAERYDSKATYGRVIDRIVEMPTRPAGDFLSWPISLLDYAEKRTRDLIAEEARSQEVSAQSKLARWIEALKPRHPR